LNFEFPALEWGVFVFPGACCGSCSLRPAALG